MGMTKSWEKAGRWPWQRRLEGRSHEPKPYPVCREITRQVEDLRNNGGVPDVCRLGPGEHAAWLNEMAAQGLRPSCGYEGMPIETVSEAGIQVIGRAPPGWE